MVFHHLSSKHLPSNFRLSGWPTSPELFYIETLVTDSFLCIVQSFDVPLIHNQVNPCKHFFVCFVISCCSVSPCTPTSMAPLWCWHCQNITSYSLRFKQASSLLLLDFYFCHVYFTFADQQYSYAAFEKKLKWILARTYMRQRSRKLYARYRVPCIVCNYWWV